MPALIIRFFILSCLLFPGLASAATPMVAAGWGHFVALKSDGTVMTWGSNTYGQLGDGTTTDRDSPAIVPELTGVVAVAAGYDYTIAVKSDGTVMAWGANYSSQLGDGTTTDRHSPVTIPGLTGIVAVSTSWWNTVALKSDGTVVVWGDSFANHQQRINGVWIENHSPVAVPELTGVVSVAMGLWHIVALKSDGTVVTVGQGVCDWLDDGTATQHLGIVTVPGLTGVVAVAAGELHDVALKSDGTVMAWEYHGIGDLSDVVTASPVPVPGLTGIKSVTMGHSQNMAVKTDGTVVVWGYISPNYEGDVPGAIPYDPVALTELTGTVVGVALGWNYHAVALKSDGTMEAINPLHLQMAQAGIRANVSQAIGEIVFSPATLAVTTAATANATATSGLAVIFSSMTPDICTVKGDTVTGIAPGICTITADQAGDTFYSVATRVTQSVIVGDMPPISLVSSWNLLGNSLNVPLAVADTFGDAAKIFTVWKWIPATGKWAFYTPNLADGGAAYAASNGYDFLTTINGGEGFWVNAKAAFTAQLPMGAIIRASYFRKRADPALNKLSDGWNLIAMGENMTPAEFNDGLTTNDDLLCTPPTPGVVPLNFMTLWAWDSVLSNWYFYAPSLQNSGELASYIARKDYLDFSANNKRLEPGSGFWVNHNAETAAQGRNPP